MEMNEPGLAPAFYFGLVVNRSIRKNTKGTGLPYSKNLSPMPEISRDCFPIALFLNALSRLFHGAELLYNGSFSGIT